MATVRHLGLFPWCGPFQVNPTFVGEEGTLRSIGLTLQQMMKLYWRIKKVRMTSPDGMFVVSGNHTIAIVSADWQTTNFDENNTEKNLVCSDGGYQFVGVPVFSIQQGGYAVRAEFIMSNTVYNPQTKLFFPVITVAFGQNGAFGTSRWAEGFAEENLQHYQYIDFLDLGVQISMGGSDAQPFATGAISVEEYWPYDPNDGLGPIYDSTTGEQLRPFPA
jgi:hypothetical protein